MATVVAVSQTSPAVFGEPVSFVVSIQNTAGTPITLTSVQPQVLNMDGTPATAYTLGSVAVPPAFSTSIGASSTVYLPFTATFYGQAVMGGPASPSCRWLVTATAVTTDGATTAQQRVVGLNQPIFGLSPGSPPNAATASPGGLQFSNPANSAFFL